MMKQKFLMILAAFALAIGSAQAQAPTGMALVIGNALYDAADGRLMNAHFLQGPPVDLSNAVASDTCLYVAGANGYVAKYDLRTGALINPYFIAFASFNTSWSVPLALKGNTLFIPGTDPHLGNTINTFDATTGAPLRINFITGFYAYVVEKLLVVDNLLFIAGVGPFTYSYDATTGALINGNALVDPVGPVNAWAVAANYLFGFAVAADSTPEGLKGYPIIASLGGYQPPLGPGGPYAYQVGGSTANTPLASLGNYLFFTNL